MRTAPAYGGQERTYSPFQAYSVEGIHVSGTLQDMNMKSEKIKRPQNVLIIDSYVKKTGTCEAGVI